MFSSILMYPSHGNERLVILFLVDLLQSRMTRMTELFKVPYTDMLKHQAHKYESDIMLRHWKVMLVGIHTHHFLALSSTNNSDLNLFPEKHNITIYYIMFKLSVHLLVVFLLIRSSQVS